ncbi:MAG: hypothetical protein K2R98_24855 [Gemmataceae bacterium]|nr:hypothetical protein [Gemmataceae bacterium]
MKPIDFTYRFDPSQPIAKEPETADEAQRILEAGNRLFARWTDSCLRDSGDTTGPNSFIVPCTPSDLGMPTPEGLATKQAPFAALLGCSDARVPAEIIFGQVRNNMFVVRVAGNVLTDEALGSIEYALHHLKDSMRLIVVLGHTGCGAVSATVDTYLNPWNYLANAPSRALRSIVDQLMAPVRKSADAVRSVWGPNASDMPGYREVLIETAVFVNVVQAAYNLRLEQEQAGRTNVKVVYGVFDLLTHRIWTAPPDDSKATIREVVLARAPTSLEEFEELSVRVALRMARRVGKAAIARKEGPHA